MGEAKGVEIGEVENLSTNTNRYPRDLLQRLTATNHRKKESNFGEESEEIELNLGLSLGGKFGVEPKGSSNKLYRSTSIATFLREDDPPPPVYPLIRTSSLPMESEEEWRKRKEMQTLRRMEAKRKRSEKQKNTRLARERTCSLERNFEVDLNPAPVKQQQQQFLQPVNGFSPAVTMPFGMPHWASSFQGSAPQNNKFDVLTGAADTGTGQGTIQRSSQGSMGSHCSSSSGISEFESRSVQGFGNCNGESRSPPSIQSVPNQIEQKPVISSTSTDTKTSMSVKVEVESPKKKPRLPDNGMRETGMKVMEEMPCVSTKGDGPNGRKIEGFLYKYKKGEEVRIVCVCHGSFLTPAEFVKHAGGGDVTHPLRHITVSPNPSFL
ncbi:hypothetical protein ACHQM5_006667 [Ranunculus cassubicifolius]